jgi:hypothetical protein
LSCTSIQIRTYSISHDERGHAGLDHINGKFNSSSSLGVGCARTPIFPSCPSRERKRSRCATRGNPLSFKRWVGVRASMAAVQDSMHCGCRFLFWCIFAQILCRTRFRSAVAVESNEACKSAQFFTGPQKGGATQNRIKHRSADQVGTSLQGEVLRRQ